MDPLNHHNIIIQGECRHINDGSRIIKVNKVTVDKLSMREATGSRAGGVVVVLSDPRQVTLLLPGPFSTPYGGGGVEAGGRLAS
jgi:hypothetical protein